MHTHLHTHFIQILYTYLMMIASKYQSSADTFFFFFFFLNTPITAVPN